ncbi:F-box/kelch-repeat protein, partial [Trifolium medium]|nr:F-box/kelch-repeat protein [Trifolium medium]
MQTLKFGIEKFDGKMKFGLWQIQVKDIMIQSGLHKILRGTRINDVFHGRQDRESK